MSSTTSTSLKGSNSLLRLSVIGGLIIGTLHLVIQVGVVYGLILGSQFSSALQYVTSGIMGDAAYAGGLRTAPCSGWYLNLP